jgi:LDH2 family malate/lactate/ureidoglycolate dehydrogenase
LVDLFIDRVKGSSRVDESVPIYVPGELEDLRRADALSNGLEIYDGVAGDLRYTGEKLGIDLSLEDCVISN